MDHGKVCIRDPAAWARAAARGRLALGLAPTRRARWARARTHAGTTLITEYEINTIRIYIKKQCSNSEIMEFCGSPRPLREAGGGAGGRRRLCGREGSARRYKQTITSLKCLSQCVYNVLSTRNTAAAAQPSRSHVAPRRRPSPPARPPRAASAPPRPGEGRSVRS